MTPTFELPRSFVPLEFLSGRLTLRADDARWLVSTVLRKTANRDTDPWGCVRLHSSILRRVMDSHTMGDVIRALENGAIETAPYYAGVKARGFRLAKRYLGDRSVRVPCVDPRLLGRLEQERQRWEAGKPKAGWKPIHFLLDAEQRQLTIDPAADDILVTLPEHTRLCQDVLVSRLQRREFSFSVSSTNRVFNAITGLKRELRGALRIGGEPVGGVDIACAQPALLALEMELHSPTNGPKSRATYKDTPLVTPAPALPHDSSPSPATPCSFASLTCSGRLYEHLMGLTGLGRADVKRAILRDVLAKRGRYPSLVEQAFRRAFPDAYTFIRAVNRPDHGELIRRLQRLESWLVIEKVAPRLVGRVPVLTLHDAIYSTRRCLATVKEAFEEVFEQIGFRLVVKPEVPESSEMQR
ncbi:MAG: hypothetical protein ABIP48_07855 [Planctomycetota bacterium]